MDHSYHRGLFAIKKAYKKYFHFKTLVSAVLVLGIILSVVALVRIDDDKTSEVDLLNSNQRWTYLPGAERTNDGLRIKPVNLQISHNDSSEPQPNPAVNIVDSPLIVNGDFLVTAKLSELDSMASLQLYGQIPIIFDEWRYERKSVRIDISGDKLRVRIWDGSAVSYIDERIYDILLIEKSGTLSVVHKNGNVIISLNNRLLGSIPDHYVFSDGKVWFGLMASPGTDGWKLNSLSAFGLNKGNVEIAQSNLIESPIDIPPDGLRKISESNVRKIPIGVAVSSYPFFTNPQYADIVRQQFNMITPENEMKFQFIQPIKGTYTYEYADALVKSALDNNTLVHGHMLIAHKSNPAWVEKSDKTERKQILTDHVNNVVGHYKGKVAQWDVINEPMSDDDLDYASQNLGLRKQLWFDAMGEDYIDTAFKTAREADPSAKLFLNEYGIGKDGIRWDGLVALLQRLKARGVPIDGVGFESHVYHAKDSVDPEVLRRHIKQIGDMGLISRISENDVLGDDPALQTAQYTDILKICLEQPTCTSYGTWGVSDLYGSTTSSDRYPPVLGDSLIWDKDFKPKEVLSGLQNTLRKY